MATRHEIPHAGPKCHRPLIGRIIEEPVAGPSPPPAPLRGEVGSYEILMLISWRSHEIRIWAAGISRRRATKFRAEDPVLPSVFTPVFAGRFR